MKKLPAQRSRFYQQYIKRLLDIILSFCGIVCLLPLFLLIAVAIEIDDPGPVFFFQRRSGWHEKPFTIAKFRTMRAGAPRINASACPENAAQCVTRVGRFLRRTSMDELPQLFQILAGAMSLVGPRPLVLGERAIAERRKYGANDVRPGLTGWAQINGRNRLSDEEKAGYDGEYVQRMSFCFDCECLFKTIGKVIRCEDVCE